MNKTMLIWAQLVVVGLIVAILLGVGSMGILRARESARLNQCRNNLKQLMMGLQNYHDVFQALPYGARARGGNGMAGGFGPSWLVSALPFCGQKKLFDNLDRLERTSTHGYNTVSVQNQVVDAKVGYMRCPSSPLPQMEKVFAGVGPLVVPSYVGISGGVASLTPGSPQSVTSNGQTYTDAWNKFRRPTGGGAGLVTNGGFLVPNETFHMSAAIDGTSKVLVIGETSDYFFSGGTRRRIDGSSVCGWTCGTDTYDKVGSGPDAFASHNLFNLTTIAYPVGTNGKLPAKASPARPIAAIWNQGGIGQGTATSGHGVNNPLVSAHPGGALSVFLDGHTQFLPATTDIVILLRLATRDDGGKIGEF